MGRLLQALVVGLMVWSLSVQARAAEVPGANAPVVVVAELTGTVDAVSAQYVSRVVREAEAVPADVLLVELNTPGGFAFAMESMTQTMLGSSVPTVVYVTPAGARAGSAGVFIAMAADVVAMAPGTVIGAAHPIGLGSSQLDSVEAEKATNYAAAYARAVATAKGHNADWADQAVRTSATLTEVEALRLGVADLVARDRADLLAQLEGRRVVTAGGPRTLPRLSEASVREYPMNLSEIALQVVSSPDIALLLLILAAIGIVAEVYHPGAFLPGIVGTISLLLALVALGLLPTNWGAVALLGVSLTLFLLELQLPSHGILGAGAVVAFLLGGLLLFAPLTPAAPVFATVTVSPWLLIVGSGVLVAFFLLALRAGLRARRLPVVGLVQRLDGARGVTTTWLAPAGTVLVLHEQWSARAEDGPIEPGTAVEVVGRAGLTLLVRRAAAATTERTADDATALVAGRS